MDATQTELLEQARENAVTDVRVSMPAKVISFDASTKTVKVEICMQMVNADDTYSDYPVLDDCPCFFTRGGGFHVTHPYKEGDMGAVLFSDRCLDGWFESGKTAPPMDYRIHSMSDAYFIGGADHLGNVSPIIDDAMFIGKDDNSAGIKISGSGELDFYGTKSTFHHDVFMSKDLTVTGMLNAIKGAIIKGIDFILHVHGGVRSGGDDSGVAK